MPPNKVMMSIPAGIGAIGSAVSSPNRSLCCVVREGTLWWNDAWRRRRRNTRKKNRRWWFLQQASLYLDWSWRSPSSYRRHGAPLLAFKHTSISKHTMEQVYIVKTRKKLSCIIFISYTKAQRISKLWCLFVAGLDHCTADAEHRRWQRRHIYVAYVPPHAPCPWFGMLAMFRAMAAEVWWVLISTSRFQAFGGLYIVSHALDLLFGCCFLQPTSVGLSWGAKPCFLASESGFMTPLFLPTL